MAAFHTTHLLSVDAVMGGIVSAQEKYSCLSVVTLGLSFTVWHSFSSVQKMAKIF